MTATDSSLDTNILFYAFDPANPRKQDIAQRLLALHRKRSALALQVLAEFYQVTSRKLHDAETASSLVRDLRQNFRIISAGDADLLEAMNMHQRYRFQFFDCLILATLLRDGCRLFLTEDLQHERTLHGLRILNPFFLTPAELDSLFA